MEVFVLVSAEIRANSGLTRPAAGAGLLETKHRSLARYKLGGVLGCNGLQKLKDEQAVFDKD